jgi:hypothetical protein
VPAPAPSADEANVTISRTSSVPQALVIGSVVGGFVLLCLFALGIWFYMRPRRETAALLSGNGTQAPPDSGVAHLPTSDVRWSAATAVDIEAGVRAMEKAERDEKVEKAHGWFYRSIKGKLSEPATPPLPLQDYTPSPSTPLPLGLNPILGMGVCDHSSNTAGDLVPSSSRPVPAPAPAPTTPLPPRLVVLAAEAEAISSPKAPLRAPPPPPLVIGFPPRGRHKNSIRGRAPSVGTGLGGPSRSRSLTSHEIRRSRSAQVVREQTQMDGGNEVRRLLL